MQDNLKNKLETILFMAKTPLAVNDFQEILNEDKQAIEACLHELKQDYEQKALQLIEIAGGYQIATRAEYSDVVESFVKSPIQVSLSAAAMETLAIIAYRQPISRREVENIRGVNSDAVVKSLADKHLIVELGKGDQPGKPTVFGTTDLFLKHFGLKDIKDLPPEPGMKYQLPLQKNFPVEEEIGSPEIVIEEKK